MMQYSMTPIGFFHCAAKYPYDATRQGVLSQTTGIVELEEGKGFEQALEGLAGFSRVWLLFVFDQNLGLWHPKVQPPRHSTRKVGVFASRAPYRPNPIGLTCAELLAVKGRSLQVASHDLLEGTPILDIKPYLPYADAFPEAKAGWTDQPETIYQVLFDEVAARQIAWLTAHGLPCLETFIHTRLEAEPLNPRRNRLVPNPAMPAGPPLLAYRTWRIAFSCDEATHTVHIQKLQSGYSPAELQDNAPDPYADKDLHRAFLAKWP